METCLLRKLLTAVIVLGLSIVPVDAQHIKTTVDLIIRGGTVVTMDPSHRVINDGAVAITKGRIEAVGTTVEIDGAYTSPEIINASGKVVIPGLINGHTHVPMTLFRGIADDLDLQEWLTKYIFPAEAKN